MRHRKSGRRLGRNGPHRKAMMRNMVSSLIEHGRIRTTETRAKELRKIAERLITVGKRGLRDAELNRELDDAAYTQKRLHVFRQILKDIKDKDLARKVFEYAELFSERQGGYTRILKLGYRQGDNAPISIIEFVERLDDEDYEEAE
ncbi:MAG: 50S ribosomal protein L17 [Deltaproteobacteria bacterium]|nr:50S ribosomal protein L17 [Deltaproteobacteria bacterium]MBU48319.1 50S ribosomal protein L17 [Deltaproteobacteria bacterium]